MKLPLMNGESIRIRGLSRVRQITRHLRRRFTRGALILLYHRVTTLPLDPHLLCVTPQHFAEHLEIVRNYAQPMSLQQLVQALRAGDLPPRAVVLTFDDGYADNLYHAKPLLEQYGIPATVFITTGYVGRKCEFWWDELERLLLQPGTLPETLCLSVNGRIRQWELGAAADYSVATCQRHCGWNIEQRKVFDTRQHLFRAIYQLLYPLPAAEQWKVLEALHAWAGSTPRARATHRTLEPDEVAQLVAADNIIEVGAHTVTHPMLAALPVAMQREEIGRSKAYLEDVLGRSVMSFSYPYGSRSAYSKETVAAVREAGFACACSNFAEIVWQNANYFELPRLVVRDWDGETFARWLRGWLGD